MHGEIRSRYSLVDYKPIRELSGQFEIKDGRVSLTSFSFGNLTGLAMRGTYHRSPHRRKPNLSLVET